MKESEKTMLKEKHKRLMRRSAPALLLAAGLVISGCQSGNNVKKQDKAVNTDPAAVAAAEPAQELVFWSTKDDVFADVTKEFTKQTGIKVTGTFMGNYDDMVDKVMVGIASQDLPNVSQLGQRHGLAQMYDSGWLLPVEDYVDQTLLDDIIPGFWKRFTYKGKKVILPFQNSMPVLYYNKNLLQKAGAEVPRTFAETVAAAKVIKDKTGEYGFSLNSDYPWYINALFFNSGISPVTEEGKGNLSNPAGIKVFEWIRQLAIEDKSMPQNQHKTAQEDFSNGKIGMFMSSCASYKKITGLVGDKFELGVALFPKISTMDIPMGGNGLGMFKGSPEEIKAAKLFVEFMLEKGRIANSTLNSGYIPVTNAATATNTYKEYLSDPNRQVVDQQMQYLGGAAVNPADSLVWNEIRDIVDAIEADPNLDLTARLAQSDQKIDKYSADYNKK